MDANVTTNYPLQSPKSSTPRHPINMGSTVKPPDPMPCALAAILLLESLAQGCHMQKTMFLGPSCTAGISQCVLGPCLRAGCDHAARAVGGSQNDDLRAGRRCLTPRVGGDCWSSCTGRGASGGCTGAWARGGPNGVVNDSCAESCMRGLLG